MEKTRYSVVFPEGLQGFKDACKLAAPQTNSHSTSILLQKRPISVDSISDISTLQYLERFRKRIGYKKVEDDSSAVEKLVVDVDEQEEDALNFADTKGKRDSCNDSQDPSKSYRLNAQQFEDSAVLDEFWNLNFADISDNELKSVKNLGGMPYLEKINASKNLLEIFLEITPPAPAALKELDFSFNKINSIVELKQYWSLTHINLSHNELVTVEGFSGLDYLQVLDLSNNKIESIVELDCRNLITLDLSFNHFEEITEYIGCPNLRTLNLLGNKLCCVSGLKHLPELTSLDLTENNIQDIIELEHLKTLLNLTHLKLHLNPITTVENWRLVLVYALPQILWLDESFIEPTDLRTAANLFKPSFKKLAFMDHAAILLDRECQSANDMFDGYCRNRPFPPILLLVGPPRSHCHALALLLKQKFRNKVHLGGVHSTATTMEGSNPKLDIPVSYESFQEMRNRGELLGISQILGRVCGFATSQIARAAEKGALLVAAVPLSTALALRDWKLKPKLVLALPSIPPEFPEEEERTETIKRSVGSADDELVATRAKGSAGHEEGTDQADDAEEDHHLVNFAELLSVVPSAVEETDPEKLLYSDNKDQQPGNEIPQHSILKTPKFEVAEDEGVVEDLKKGSTGSLVAAIQSVEFVKKKSSGVKIISRQSEFHHGKVVDLEKKGSARLKSIAPGLERYSHDADDDDISDDYEEEEEEFGLEFDEDEEEDFEIQDETEEENEDSEIIPSIPKKMSEPKSEEGEEEMKDQDEDSQGEERVSLTRKSQTQVPQGKVPPTLIYGSQRLNRLASLLMLQQRNQSLISSLNVADILMNLSSVDKIDPKLLQTVDLSTAGTNNEILEEQAEENGGTEFSGAEEDAGNEAGQLQNGSEAPAQKREGSDTSETPKITELMAGLCNPFQWPMDGEIEELEQNSEGAFDQDAQSEENGESLGMDQKEADNANVVSDERDLPRVSNSRAQEEFQPNNSELKKLTDTTVTTTEPNKKQIKNKGNKGLRFIESNEDENLEEEGSPKPSDPVNEPSREKKHSARTSAVEESERRESNLNDGRKSKDGKIKEPVHLTESEHLLQTAQNEEDHEHQPTHKEAMTLSIEKTKEKLSNFHFDNPGFFHAVVDTADMCESYKTVENLAMESLINFKQESMANGPTKSQIRRRSHAGSNQVDAECFLDERMLEMNRASALWIRGLETRKETLVKSFQLNSSQGQPELLFGNLTCPSNLLDPTMHKPPITLKMKRLVELHNKRTKCANVPRTSCSLSYLDDCQ